jgi:hypothetical protein
MIRKVVSPSSTVPVWPAWEADLDALAGDLDSSAAGYLHSASRPLCLLLARHSDR